MNELGLPNAESSLSWFITGLYLVFCPGLSLASSCCGVTLRFLGITLLAAAGTAPGCRDAAPGTAPGYCGDVGAAKDRLGAGPKLPELILEVRSPKKSGAG